MKRITILRKSNQGLKYLTLLLLFFTMCLSKAGAQDVTVTELDGEHIYKINNGNVVAFNGVDGSYVSVDGYMTHKEDNQFTWTGWDGYYAFKTYKADARGKNYIEITPLNGGITQISGASQGGKATDANGNWNIYIQNGDRVDYYDATKGTGSIWLGSGSEFGFPEWGHDLWGWGHGSDYYGLNTTVLSHPKDTKKYYFDIKIGQHYNPDGNFAIKFYHRRCFESSFASPDYKDNTYRKVFEFDWDLRDNSTEPDGNYDSYRAQIRFRNKNGVMDYLSINKTGKDDSYVGNGNIEGLSTLEYSQMPKLPKWYTFHFLIDFDDSSNPIDGKAWSATWAPLDVSMTSRPTTGTDDITWAEDMVNGSDFNSTSVTGNDLKISVQLNNRPNLEGSKRIWLRDALRFDQCILYANQGLDNNNCFYKTLTITSELNDKDMAFLSAILKKNRIETLDLSQAKIPSNTIPANWAEDCTSLTTIKLPAALTSIGNSAFKSCSALASITFENGASLTNLGISAFEGCTALTNTPVANVVSILTGEISSAAFKGCNNEGFTELRLPTTVASIGSEALSGDVNIKDVYLPKKVTANATEENPTATEKVGEAYTTLKVTGTTTKADDVKGGDNMNDVIQARFFNKTLNKGYYAEKSNDKNGGRDDNASVNFWEVGTYEQNGNHWVIGDTQDGYYFNYTFNCSKAGKYTIHYFAMSNHDDGENTDVTTYIDGAKIGVVNFEKYSTADTKYESGSGNYWHRDWCEDNKQLENINISEGNHVFKIALSAKMTLYKFWFEYTGEYVQTGEITSCTPEDAFKGVNPNKCEVHFDGDDTEGDNYNHYKEYRAEAQEGWLYLLTKDLYENNSSNIDNAKDYSTVNYSHQSHANVRLNRVLSATSEGSKNGYIWDSFVLPFDVLGGTDNTAGSNDNPEVVNTKENTIRYAAVYRGISNGTVIFYNVGTHNDSPDNKHESETLGKKDYKIEAGTPFLARLNGTTDTHITFVDVEMKNNATVKSELRNGVWFTGTFNAISKHNVPTGGIWALSNSKLVKATQTAQFKGYRCWFQTNDDPNGDATKLFPVGSTAVGAKASIQSLSLDSKMIEGGTTGIDRLMDEGRIVVTDAIYTTTGVRVSNPQKGIYIVNGKKVVIK